LDAPERAPVNGRRPEGSESPVASDDRRPRGFGWGIGIGVATFLTLVYPTQHYIAEHYTVRLMASSDTPAAPVMAWTDRLLLELPVWYLWVAFGPLILALARRFPIAGPRRYRNLGVHLLASAILSTVHILALSFYRGVLPIPLPPGVSVGQIAALTLLQYLLTMMTVYATIVAVQHAIAHYRESQARAMQAVQLETRLANARLDVLKMQLQPHFLFNTLNTISSLTLSDARAAQRMIVRLSDLLRLSLENLSIHEIPLSQELDFLQRYAEIQQVRFSDRLALDYRIEEGAEKHLVPRLMLQPLVENAIRHGVERTSKPIRIQVRAHQNGDFLRIDVEDDGPGMDPTRRNGASGIGLRNTRARLQQLYGDRQSLAIGRSPTGGVVVEIAVPLRLPLQETPVEATICCCAASWSMTSRLPATCCGSCYRSRRMYTLSLSAPTARRR
jgi:two-component system LytT family sensor kinase